MNDKSIIWLFSGQQYFLPSPWHDWELYFPARALACAGEDDLIFLPAHKAVTNLVRLYEQKLWQRSPAIIPIPVQSPLFENDVLNQAEKVNPLVSKWAKKQFEKGNSIEIIPWENSPAIQQWLKTLDFDYTLQACNINLVNCLAHNRYQLMQKARDSGMFLMPFFLLCQHEEDIARAMDVLKRRKIPKAIVKPVDSSGGEGFQIITIGEATANHSLYKGRPAILEAWIPHERSFSIQFVNNTCFGALCEQEIKDYQWKGSCCPAVMPMSLPAEFFRWCEKLLADLGDGNPVPFAGMDFLYHQGKFFLVDINFCRLTGSHIAKFFCEWYAPGRAFVIRQINTVNIGAVEAWNMLEKRDIAFDCNLKRGVFPVNWLSGIYCQLISIAEDLPAAINMMDKAERLFT